MGRDSAARALPKVEKRPPRSDKLDSRHHKRRQVIVQAKTSRSRERVFRTAAVDQAACHGTAAVPPATSASASGAAALLRGVAMRPPPAHPASCPAARLLRCGSSSCAATRRPQPFRRSHLATPSPPPPSRHHSTRVDASVSRAAEASPRLFRASFVACIRSAGERHVRLQRG